MKGNPVIGWQYVWQGFALLNQPGLRRFVVLPLLINTVIMSAATWWGGTRISSWIERLVSWLPGWLEWLYWLLMPLALLTLMLVLAYLFSSVLVALASPFNGLLSEGVERRHGESLPQESIAELVTRTFGRELTKLGYLLPRYLILLVLSIVPGINLLSPLLWFWFGSWVMALQYADYSYDNHGISFREVRRSLAGDNLTALGFGALVAVLMMIPVVNWFVMPAAVIGATLMRLERLPLSAGGKNEGFNYAEKSSNSQRLTHGGSQHTGRG